jgi:hypothetical protein
VKIFLLTNREAKSTAWDKYEDAKKALADYKAGAHGNQGHKAKLGGKAYKKRLKELEGRVKHWKKKADATGETHGRKGKGHR